MEEKMRQKEEEMQNFTKKIEMYKWQIYTFRANSYFRAENSACELHSRYDKTKDRMNEEEKKSVENIKNELQRLNRYVRQ